MRHQIEDNLTLYQKALYSILVPFTVFELLLKTCKKSFNAYSKSKNLTRPPWYQLKENLKLYQKALYSILIPHKVFELLLKTRKTIFDVCSKSNESNETAKAPN